VKDKVKDELPLDLDLDPKVFKRIAMHSTEDIAERAPDKTRKGLYNKICRKVEENKKLKELL
jgi:hypothetical protein